MTSRRLIIGVGASLALLSGLATLAPHVDRFLAPDAAQAAGALTKGPFPNAAIDGSGRVRYELVPDFVSALTRSGKHAGCVPKQYLLDPELTSEDIPVYSDDLRTRVGTMVQGRGFVAAGADPESVPAYEVRTIAD